MGNHNKFTTRGSPSPAIQTTAKITVADASGIRLAGAEVEIKGAGKAGKGKTDGSGVFKTKVLRAGTYNIEVKAQHFGPPQPAGKIVTEGPVVRKVKLLPNTKLPPQGTNEIGIVVQQENPRIHITVIEDKGILGSSPLAGASIEIIGKDSDTSNANGLYISPYLPFGKYWVLVKKAGLFPQNQEGDAFYRWVELRERGTDPASGPWPPSRDLKLDVTLGIVKAAGIPPLVSGPVAVWASGDGTPHTVAEDPRLNKDSAKGQAGWDMGFQFASFSDLSWKLQGAKPAHLGGGMIQLHQVSRLAFVAHGAPGVVDVDQSESGDYGVPIPLASRSLTVNRIGVYNSQLDRIGEALRQNSVVYVASCQAADSKEGEELLKMLSKRWPTTTVVGIRTLATVVSGMHKPLTSPSAIFAGVRDTRHANGIKKPGEIRDYETTEFRNDLNKLPWLSESSPHTTVARDGNIIRRGNPAE